MSESVEFGDNVRAFIEHIVTGEYKNGAEDVTKWFGTLVMEAGNAALPPNVIPIAPPATGPNPFTPTSTDSGNVTVRNDVTSNG